MKTVYQVHTKISTDIIVHEYKTLKEAGDQLEWLIDNKFQCWLQIKNP